MRYKGQITPAMSDRDYPHQVEIFVPGDGLGVRLSAMREFCHSLDHKTRGIPSAQWMTTGTTAFDGAFAMGRSGDFSRKVWRQTSYN
jgi:hypothetical protein